ncbi:RNA polymerase sigma factor [Phascolarctobacterium succinatutens]|uniref:RNA polymerase sigma factor n=1 Tax=Phascolarctobacterium succinatutens TaxID=626940 RepID=UPI0027BA87FF|nr:helix-turn-helix domain-containing protein [Phascolarctobacterium succinatutens]
MPEGTEPQDCTEEKTTFTLTEFKELVHSAQKGDREAINTLCNAFKPLIYKEAYRYEVREALGEDAINTAWLIFLEQIKKYKDRDFGHLPGLLQYHVHYGLLHKSTRGKSVKDCYYLDAEKEGEETQIADKDNVFERTEVNQLFSAARLSKEQTDAVNELVLNELDHRLFCKKYACSSKTAFKHRANGLKKLKSLLA